MKLNLFLHTLLLILGCSWSRSGGSGRCVTTCTTGSLCKTADWLYWSCHVQLKAGEAGHVVALLQQAGLIRHVGAPLQQGSFCAWGRLPVHLYSCIPYLHFPPLCQRESSCCELWWLNSSWQTFKTFKEIVFCTIILSERKDLANFYPPRKRGMLLIRGRGIRAHSSRD
jgi:hypothetical protein